MKPDWDKLGDEFADSKTVLIGDVDCTVEKALCSRFDVKGFPTIKVFNDGSEEAYEGGRDFAALKAFADENLGPSCNTDNKDLCSEEQLTELEALQALGEEEVKSRIAAGKAAIKEAETSFETALKELQSTYEKISKEKEEAIKTAKAPLAMLQKVKFA